LKNSEEKYKGILKNRTKVEKGGTKKLGKVNKNKKEGTM
jgi:hypothetical protein